MKRTTIINLVFLCFAAIIILVLVIVSNKPASVKTPLESSATVSTSNTPTPTQTLVPANSSIRPKPASNVTPAAPAYFTLTQVAQHKTKDDCWTIVRGSVYKVTSWISKHPGGSEAIIYMCGIDATSAFVDQHDGKRKPEAELASFKIGILQ
jgi:cytochrome b involved in lipid metabolism